MGQENKNRSNDAKSGTPARLSKAHELYSALPMHLHGWQVFDALCVALKVASKDRKQTVDGMKLGEKQDRARTTAAREEGAVLPPIEVPRAPRQPRAIEPAPDPFFPEQPPGRRGDELGDPEIFDDIPPKRGPRGGRGGGNNNGPSSRGPRGM